jgi:hypothetical protein
MDDLRIELNPESGIRSSSVKKANDLFSSLYWPTFSLKGAPRPTYSRKRPLDISVSFFKNIMEEKDAMLYQRGEKEEVGLYEYQRQSKLNEKKSNLLITNVVGRGEKDIPIYGIYLSKAELSKVTDLNRDTQNDEFSKAKIALNSLTDYYIVESYTSSVMDREKSLALNSDEYLELMVDYFQRKFFKLDKEQEELLREYIILYFTPVEIFEKSKGKYFLTIFEKLYEQFEEDYKLLADVDEDREIEERSLYDKVLERVNLEEEEFKEELKKKESEQSFNTINHHPPRRLGRLLPKFALKWLSKKIVKLYRQEEAKRHKETALIEVFNENQPGLVQQLNFQKRKREEHIHLYSDLIEKTIASHEN